MTATPAEGGVNSGSGKKNTKDSGGGGSSIGVGDADGGALDPTTVLNVNVGVLGHVDSGKTSLVKALSTHLSTAALDKSTQSRQRGMTLDLGFSCFFLDAVPPHLQVAFPRHTKVQITLVDCPGHASLIRTIIGGAQIIDVVLLVVDAVKGWQAQTTECLVLAELCSNNLIVALNKVDMLSEQNITLAQAEQRVRARLKGTKFGGQSTPIVGVSACVGGEKVAAAGGDDSTAGKKPIETSNMDRLVSVLQEKLPIPNRNSSNDIIKNSKDTASNPFYFAIDHCFPIRGRGTVLTGTCLSGQVNVNEIIEFPALGVERKVKSMQMFKRQVERVGQGDRAGICVGNLDADVMERGIAAKPDSVQLWKGAIAVVRKVKYYAGSLPGNGSKYHISCGHTTVMANVTFWGAKELLERNEKSGSESIKSTPSSTLAGDGGIACLPRLKFDFGQDFLQQDEMVESSSGDSNSSEETLLHWALLDFQTPVHCPLHSLIIGSRLDMVDANSNAMSGLASSCRLAFSGRLVERIDPEKDASRLRLYTPKERRGVISRLGDPHKRVDDGKLVRYEIFGTDLFKKETNMKVFIGMKLVTEAGDVGEIKSSFGTSGNFRVWFPAGTEAKEGDTMILKFKRFAHDPNKDMHQDMQLPAARVGNRIEVVEKKKKKNEPGVHRVGEIASVKGDTLENGKQNMAIISGFFAPEVNIKEKAGTKVVIPSTKEEGTVIGPFGKAGKCKVSFEHGVSAKVGDKAELKL
jgi:selenocysteine-specific elongation factor